MLAFHPSNPFRPVNWRWELARTHREKRTKFQLTTDQFAVEAFKFQKRMDKCKDDDDRYRLMDAHPELYSAYLIFRRGDNDDKHPMRYALEARLLADQSYREIAMLLGLNVKTIEYYEKLFFNIEGKLQNSDYIMTCVLGPSIHSGLSDRDYDLLWKLFGYLYGPVVLDSFISTTSRKFKPETNAEVDTALAEDTRSSIQRKVAVIARTYTVNPFSQSELLHIYARLLEVEKDMGQEKAHDVILQNVQVMMDKLPFKLSDDKQVGSAEVRTQQLLELSTGQEPNIIELAFPEKKND